MIVNIKKNKTETIPEAFGISEDQTMKLCLDLHKAFVASELEIEPYIGMRDDYVKTFKYFVEHCDLKSYGLDPKTQEHMIALGMAFANTLSAMREQYNHFGGFKINKISLNAKESKSILDTLGLNKTKKPVKKAGKKKK